MTEESDITRETRRMPEVEVETIAPNGLGYGIGPISVTKRLGSGDLTPGVVAITEREVNDPDNLVEVEFHDDGCSDGRGTGRVYRLTITEKGLEQHELKRSGYRAKILGGGLVIGWIADRAVKGEITEDDSVVSDRRNIAQRLRDADMQFGTHTSDHAPKGKTGCGAIDESPAIVVAAVEFADKIRENVMALRPELYTEDRFNKVIDTFRSMAESETYFGDGSIEETRRIIAEAQAIVKELKGGHEEIRIVRNEVKGRTLNQVAINAQTGDKGEVFVDDVWRRDEYAYVVGNGHDEETAIAALATEVWTLAVAATLTDGTLPVDRIREKAAVTVEEIPEARAA